MESPIPTFHTFLAFFIWSVYLVCISHFFSHFLSLSKLFKWSLSFWRCPETEALIYIRDLLVLLYMESSIGTVCTYYLDFFWSVNYTSLAWKLCLLFQTILDLWSLLRLEVFSSEIIKRVSFNFWLLCKHWLFWFVTCTNHVCIS